MLIMSQRTHKWVVCLAVVLTAPVGAAVWSVEGAIEPSTPSDVDGQFMFLGNHVGFGEQVYYNAFPVSHCCLVGVVNHNPNVHYLQGTSLLPPGEMTIEAFLGLWKDCNNDGVIGAVETAFTSYRAELLDNANRDICADSPHIQDGWVHEFRWIVPTPADRDDLLTYP
ncbi:MAG TPA: hypothetical protein VHH36_08160, partial [Candidatus Thermoplasmatota archaeon]|nr:hypothetical protein [Candidatus Thermoplasmatota archaeon]